MVYSLCMQLRGSTSNKLVIGGVVALVALALLWGSVSLLGQNNRPSETALPIATPTARIVARLDPTPTPPATPTPKPPSATAIPATSTALPPSPTIATAPTEEPTVQAAVVLPDTPEPTLPDFTPVPGGAQTAVAQPPPPAPKPGVAKTPTPKPAAKPPAAKPTPNVPILPNGVRYGDRRPANLANRITRIASANIKLDAEVYEVYATEKGEWEVAEWAAGHHYNSVNPGDGGNIVISGHNNWKGEVFRYLENLKPGNIIDVWTQDGKKYRYQVKELKKLKEKGATYAQRLKNGEVMKPTADETLTLITCWPYTTFTHRIVVIAKPVE